MKREKTIGDELIALRSRAGLSLAAIAQDAGYAGPSSVQAYFRTDYDPATLPLSVSAKLEKALLGKGSPPIASDDFFRLVWPRGPGQAVAEADETSLQLHRNLLVYALGPTWIDVGDTSVEAHEFGESDHSYMYRPTPLTGVPKAYAAYVAGTSMEPRYRPGELVIANPSIPPAPGDDVIVQLRQTRESDAGRFKFQWQRVLVKTLVSRNAQYVELEEYEPRRRFKVPTSDLTHIHRISPFRELLA